MPASSGAPKVVVTTIPKSGTHLLDSILERIPPMRRIEKFGLNANLKRHPYNFVPFGEQCPMGIGRPITVRAAAVKQRLGKLRPGSYGLGQIPYSPTVKRLIGETGAHMIVAIRDPRAIVVSLMHHSLKKDAHFLHDRLKAMDSDKERLAALISGVSSTSGEHRRGLAHQIDLILGWIDDPDTLTVRFEDLVGAAGGGDDARQVAAIRELGQHIGRDLPEDEAARIGTEMFGKGRTFRSGSIDSWRDALDDDLIAALNDEIGDRLERLGYHA